MKSFILIVSVLFLFSSCTTAYKSGQTPDDVYYSPARPVDEYVKSEEKEKKEYQDEYAYRDDRYLRYKVRNPYWSSIDEDYYYNYRPYYSYSPYYSSYNPYYNSSYWNYCHNPYAKPVPVSVKTVYAAPRTSNMNVYINPGGTSNPKGVKGYSGNNTSTRSGSSSGKRSSGSFLRDIFSGGSSSSSSEGGSYGSNGSSSGSSSSGKSSSGGSSSRSSSGSSGGGGGTKASVRKF